jgi:hypothetical protein
VVQNDELIRNRHASCHQLGNSPNDATLIEIALGVIVFADDKDPRMVSAHRHDQVLQIPEIVVILGKANAVLSNGVRQMHRVIFTGHARVPGDLDIMPRLS